MTPVLAAQPFTKHPAAQEIILPAMQEGQIVEAWTGFLLNSQLETGQFIAV